MTVNMPVKELAYEETLQLTGETDFGIAMAAAMSGEQAIPPEGLRFDSTFVGELTGPKLSGKVEGIDYVLMRGDGIVKLHAHAVITTTDGDRISFFADGTAVVGEGTPIAQLRENVVLHTACPEYAWVNREQFWATGELDLSTGKGTLKGYMA